MRPHEIDRHQAHPQQVELVLSLNPDLFWFNGHFTVKSLLPGVAQIDWVMHYATTLLAPGWRFHSIQNVKFLSPLLPETTVTLTLNWQEERQILTFNYQFYNGETRLTASHGKIRLCH